MSSQHDIESWLREVVHSQSIHLGTPLPGATTATIHPVLASRADGSTEALIVKVYDLGIDGVGPDDVARDRDAMLAAAESGIDAPRLVDADGAGDRLGVPAIVMTRLAGSARAWGGHDPDGWVDGLADALIAVATAPQPRIATGSYSHWFDRPVVWPEWVADPGLSRTATALLDDPIPASAPRFMHRDFHQLNVLWDGSSVSGVVDWVNGCRGPIESDIATCRINIAVSDRRYDGIALADRFLARCLDAGLPWHPVWDVEFLAGMSRPDSLLVGNDLGADMTSASVQAGCATMLRRAVDAAS